MNVAGFQSAGPAWILDIRSDYLHYACIACQWYGHCGSILNIRVC